jgi:ubiquinone/menaquinone biosynthesis C-methylase UbiE
MSSRAFANLILTRENRSELPADESRYDAAFLVTILDETPNPEACLRQVYRALRPSGLLAVTEQPGISDVHSFDTVRTLAERQGFVYLYRYAQGQRYTANFRKPGSDLLRTF